MAMPKSIQTRFVGIRKKSQPLYIPTLAFLDYYRPIDVDLFKTCYPWSVLDLHVEEIHVLPVSQFLLFMIPMLLKKQA